MYLPPCLRAAMICSLVGTGKAARNLPSIPKISVSGNLKCGKEGNLSHERSIFGPEKRGMLNLGIPGIPGIPRLIEGRPKNLEPSFFVRLTPILPPRGIEFTSLKTTSTIRSASFRSPKLAPVLYNGLFVPAVSFLSACTRAAAFACVLVPALAKLASEGARASGPCRLVLRAMPPVLILDALPPVP